MYSRYVRGEELPVKEREAVEDFITKAAIKKQTKESLQSNLPKL